MLVDRHKEILNYLLKNRDNFISSQKIANVVGVSDKTIQKDIKDLNNYFLEKDIQVLSKRGKGYKIYLEDEEAVAKINNILSVIHKPDFFEKSVSKLIIFLIFQEKYVTKEQLQQLFFVSEKVMDSMIEIANKELLRSHIKILMVPSLGIKIEGKELSLRYAFVHQLMRLGYIPKEDWFLDYTNYGFNKMKNYKFYLNRKLNQYRIFLGEKNKKFLKYYLIISFCRENNLSYFKKNNKSFNCDPNIMQFCYDLSSIFFNSKIDEILYLSITLSFLVRESEIKTDYLSSSIKSNIERTIKNFFGKRKKFNSSLFRNIDNLMLSIYRTVLLSYFKNQIGYIEHSQDIEYIDYDMEYFVAKELASLLSFQLEEINGLFLYEDDVHKIAKLMNVYMKPIFSPKNSSILIVFDESYTNAQFLQRKLVHSGYVNTDIRKFIKLSNVGNYDLVISDCRVDLGFSTQVFEVNSLLQYNYICSSMTSMLDNKKQIMDSFLNLFSVDNFHVLTNVTNVNSLFERVLKKHGSDDERISRILDNLDKRHLHYGGLITSGVMCPIIYLDTVKSPLIEVFRFKGKTVWNNERVKLIMIYILPNDYHKIHILIPMNDLMKNKGILKNLTEVDDFSSFFNIIKNFLVSKTPPSFVKGK